MIIIQCTISLISSRLLCVGEEKRVIVGDLEHWMGCKSYRKCREHAKHISQDNLLTMILDARLLSGHATRMDGDELRGG